MYKNVPQNVPGHPHGAQDFTRNGNAITTNWVVLRILGAVGYIYAIWRRDRTTQPSRHHFLLHE